VNQGTKCFQTENQEITSFQTVNQGTKCFQTENQEIASFRTNDQGFGFRYAPQNIFVYERESYVFFIEAFLVSREFK